MTTSFADLGLPAALVATLADSGLTHPFPVQIAAIPDALAGRDVLGRGRTGSGKTLAFGLPLLTRVAAEHVVGSSAGPSTGRNSGSSAVTVAGSSDGSGSHSGRLARPTTCRPAALVLTPTRELAQQIRDSLRPYAQAMGVSVGAVVGGEGYRPQIEMLRRGVHVLVATPGRLGDLIEQGACDLSQVSITVLDEADQMADIGFLPDVCALLDQVRPGGQRLLFSATLDSRVQTLVQTYLVDPVEHSVDAAQAAVPDMDHHVLRVAPGDKNQVLAEIAARQGRSMLFVRSRLGVERVAAALAGHGLDVEPLHGGMTQHARGRTMARFKDGAISVLVATDVAARGIHVDDVDLVLHVDPPNDHRDYLHRAGRTARAGRAGAVVSLALPHQVKPLLRLLDHAGVRIQPLSVRPGSADLVAVTGARDPIAAADDLRAEAHARRSDAAARRAADPAVTGARRPGRAPGPRDRSRTTAGPRGGAQPAPVTTVISGQPRERRGAPLQGGGGWDSRPAREARGGGERGRDTVLRSAGEAREGGRPRDAVRRPTGQGSSRPRAALRAAG